MYSLTLILTTQDKVKHWTRWNFIKCPNMLILFIYDVIYRVGLSETQTAKDRESDREESFSWSHQRFDSSV